MKYYFTFVFIFLILSLKAQLIADFSVNQTEGCVPIMVSFTNNSTGDGTLTYNWDFGNGQVSTLQAPWPINYLTPGTYNVSLTVSNGSETEVKIITIKVFAKPVANFSISGITQGCIPISVSFNDLSTVADAPISSWQWEFGTGDVSSEQSPDYVYTSVGNYSTSLTIIDENGCMGTYVLDPSVKASDKPTINIIANPSNHCVVPLNVEFINNTSGLSPLSYQWNFGDGTTSTQTSPNHTYSNMGQYNVSLSVIDPYGCSSDTLINNMVDITGVTASFTTSTGSLTVCPGQVFQFINTSGNPNAHWSFGNGSSSTFTNPYMFYNTPGSYQVTLTSAVGTECEDQITQTLTVENVQAAVSVDPATYYSCENPSVFEYTYTGTPVASYEWLFGNGTDSNTPNNTVTYLYNGTYVNTLIVTSNYGCVDTLIFEVEANPIIAIIHPDTIRGCVPLEVFFNDSSFSSETIVSWEWDFNNGETSNNQHSATTFDTIGNFNVSLTVTNELGCTHTKTVEISAGYRHIPNFKICWLDDPINDTCYFCPWDILSFYNLTTDTAGNLINSSDYLYPPSYELNWFWWFGSDEFEPGPTSHAGTTQYFKQSNLGWQDNLMLVSIYNGCSDTVFLSVDSLRLFVPGPRIRSLNSTMSCDSLYHRTFYSIIDGANRWTWDLGDGTFFSTEDSLIVYHEYNDRGEYSVELIAYNDSANCFFKDHLTVTITDPIAVISSNIGDTLCVGVPASFYASDSQDHLLIYWEASNGAVINWNGVPYNNDFVTVFTTEGWHTITLKIEDIYGCRDSTVKHIYILKPTALFTSDTTMGCNPLEINFLNQSSSIVGIESLSWTLGDGTIITDVDVDSLNHVYSISLPSSNSQSFTVSITVVDSLGCISNYTENHYIKVQRAIAGFHSPKLSVCLGDTVSLVGTSSGTSLQYEWDFGNGENAYINSPSVFYTSSGFYDVSLIVSDNFGCADTLIYEDFFEIQEAKAEFYISQTDTNCYPFTPHIINNSFSEFNSVYHWDFGDGFVSSANTPVHAYTMPGTYKLLFTVTTSEGCTASDSVIINVGGPYANMIISDSIICKGDEVYFYITDTINVSYVNWNFGDGGGSNQFNDSHVYTYVPTAGAFYPSLIYCSEPNCCLPSHIDTIFVQEVIAGFNTVNSETGDSQTASCSPFNLTFPNTSVGAITWEWDLGNGQIYTGNTPSNIVYNNLSSNDIEFTITQYISNDLGCTDTISKKIIVYGTPPITISPDTIICLGNSTNIEASGGEIINWTPNAGLNNSSSYNPTAQPNISTLYIAEISDHNGCKNTDSTWVFVQQIPELIHNNDTTIIIGEHVNLFATTNQNNAVISWNPNTWISCTNCYYPISQPLETISYNIVLIDSLGCFEIISTILINVLEEYSVDLPTVFTPNNDGVNDRVYVRGWGIKNLIEFSIYNRWGEKVYWSDNISEGWDGTYNGKNQIADTYSYYVRVSTYSEKILEKKGNITLLR